MDWVDDNYIPFTPINENWNIAVQNRCHFINDNFVFPDFNMVLVFSINYYEELEIDNVMTIARAELSFDEDDFIELRKGNQINVGSDAFAKAFKGE